MTLNVVTYNIYCRQKLLFSDAQKTRCKLIPKALYDFNNNIDVILVQEIFEESAERKLDKEMKKYGFIHKSRKVGACTFLKCKCFCGRIEDGGIKTYSKHPIVDQDEHVYENYEGDGIAQKGCLWTKIEKEGKFYNLFNTHLEAGASEIDTDTRLAQCQEIADFIKDLNIDENEPVILGGDMNIDVRSQVFRQVENILRMKPVSLDESTFNYMRNEMQLRDNPGQEHTREQSQIDLLLVHNYYKQPKSSEMIYINLTSEKPFKIKNPKRKYKNCPIKCCNELSIYGDYMSMSSLSDHEPRLGFFTF